MLGRNVAVGVGCWMRRYGEVLSLVVAADVVMGSWGELLGRDAAVVGVSSLLDGHGIAESQGRFFPSSLGRWGMLSR